MHNRRARPTLRVLKEDLTSGWGNPFPRRALEHDNLEGLHPLSDLPHPIISKAKAVFGENPAEDESQQEIASATKLRLWEVKNSQWRGGVWQDKEGVRWLVVAGLAKGGHEDHDDFYKKIQRTNNSTDLERWKPTQLDTQLLKQETVTRLRTEWELHIQQLALEALEKVNAGGTHQFTVHSFYPEAKKMATVEIEVVVERGGIESDDIFLEITPENEFAGTNLLWVLTLRLLTSIYPPQQSWDRYKNTFSNIGEPGAWTRQRDLLTQLVEEEELAFSQPGQFSHYTHRKHLTRSTVEGKAVLSLCGKSFVPQSDHVNLPRCPDCEQIYAEIPAPREGDSTF